MKRYKAHSGENIFDISLKLFGAVDGVWDLMMCNPSLSFDTIIQNGDELLYDEEFVVNDDIVKWLNDSGLSVKNGHHSMPIYDVDSKLSSAMSSYSRKVYSRMQYATTALKKVVGTVYERADLYDAGVMKTFPVLKGARATDTTAKASGKAYAYNEKSASELSSATVKKTILESVDYTKTVSNNYKAFEGASRSEQTEQTVSDWFKSQVVVQQGSNYDEYYENAKEPKVVVKQYGRYSKIGVQLLSGGLFLVDWGDGSDYSYVTYSSSEVILDHTYSDIGAHRMVIYGIMNIKTLDFTELNGAYFPVRPFAVSEFKTNMEDETLNKLIYIRKQ